MMATLNWPHHKILQKNTGKFLVPNFYPPNIIYCNCNSRTLDPCLGTCRDLDKEQRSYQWGLGLIFPVRPFNITTLSFFPVSPFSSHQRLTQWNFRRGPQHQHQRPQRKTHCSSRRGPQHHQQRRECFLSLRAHPRRRSGRRLPCCCHRPWQRSCCRRRKQECTDLTLLRSMQFLYII